MADKRGVLIDPFAREIKVVTFADGNSNLKEWYVLLDCGCIDMRSLGSHPTARGMDTLLNLVVDDEGIYSKGHRQRYFKLRGFPHMLAGKCLIVATRGPDTVDLKDPEIVMEMLTRLGIVEWQDERLRFRDITTETRENVDTPYGKATQMIQTPHFALATDEEIAAENAAYAAGVAAADKIDLDGLMKGFRDMHKERGDDDTSH